MSTLKTFRFWLEPDQQFPLFKRLAWEEVDVSIRDVLMGGVHPWATTPDGLDAHPSLIDAFLQRLNDAGAKVAELEAFGYCNNVSAQQGYYYDKRTRFERTLDSVQKNMCFVDGLDKKALHFTQCAAVAECVMIHHVTRPCEPFRLDELVELLVGDFEQCL